MINKDAPQEFAVHATDYICKNLEQEQVMICKAWFYYSTISYVISLLSSLKLCTKLNLFKEHTFTNSLKYYSKIYNTKYSKVQAMSY